MNLPLKPSRPISKRIEAYLTSWWSFTLSLTAGLTTGIALTPHIMPEELIRPQTAFTIGMATMVLFATASFIIAMITFGRKYSRTEKAIERQLSYNQTK